MKLVSRSGWLTHLPIAFSPCQSAVQVSGRPGFFFDLTDLGRQGVSLLFEGLEFHDRRRLHRVRRNAFPLLLDLFLDASDLLSQDSSFVFISGPHIRWTLPAPRLYLCREKNAWAIYCRESTTPKKATSGPARPQCVNGLPHSPRSHLARTSSPRPFPGNANRSVL